MPYVTNDTVERQNEYVKTLEEQGFDFGLVVGEAFVRGMRDVGYKHTGTAIDELIDNALEAGAENVYIIFGYDKDNSSEAKPQRIAVIDDGHGMSPGMIRAAVLWGGGHRAMYETRELFGRFGFGLPSSCVSQGRLFEVFSRINGNGWYSVPIDLDKIKDGTFHKDNGRLTAPPATKAKLQRWVEEAVKENFKDTLKHGTVVVIDNLDRLSWKTTRQLNRELLQHFGVTYRKWLRSTNIFVNGVKVEPIDPLFLDSSARFHDENDLRAEALPETEIEVKDRDSGELLGVVKVRYSYMPPGFQNEGAVIKGKNNARFNVMKDNNGILVLRAGRQIDVVNVHCPWVTFQVYDRNWKVEIDFDPSLDEEFSITTSKQQVRLSDRMWSQLDQAGVRRAITALQRRYRYDLAARKQAEEEPQADQPRTSEDIMTEAEKYKPRTPEVGPEQKEKRNKRLRQVIETRAKESGKPQEQVERELSTELASMPYKLKFESTPGCDFYRVEPIAAQVNVIINQAHPFYTDVYMGPDSSPRLRAALELMLFVMAECELDANLDRQLFYESERHEWSRRLSTVLRLLDRKDPAADEVSAKADQTETDSGIADTEVQEELAAVA